MINRDWEKFGEEIRKTVQDAIDAQDYNKLNQTITNTINNAVDGIAKNLRGAGKADRAGNTGGPYAQTGPYYRQVPPNGPMKGQGIYRQGYSNSGQAPLRKVRQKNMLELYRSVTSVAAGGTVMTALGAIFGGVCFVFLLLCMIGMAVDGSIGIPGIIILAIFLVFSVSGFAVSQWGSVLRGRVKRFRAYIRILGSREYCNIRELAEGTSRNIKYVLKDLEQMLRSGWFLQGHLDEQKTCLIVSHNMYHQYLRIEEDRKKNIDDQKQGSKEKQKKDEEYSQKLSPEVRKIIEEGDAYIQKIHACNDAIPGVEISAKISRMETVIDRIFDRVEQDPEAVDDIRRMMEYYLPTTIKLLEAYQELDAQPVDGENIRSSKVEIEATLDTLSSAFEKLLDDLFQDTAWDVSTDISVLRTMLAQDGLTEDALKK